MDYAELLPRLFELEVGNFYIALAGEPDRTRVMSFRRSIREWKVLKRYATALWRQRDIFQSMGNIVAIIGSLRASLAASRSLIVQSWLPARFTLR